jgi:flagellar export protein FliJ
MKPNTVRWDVLASKAEGTVTACQKKWVQASQHQQQLQQSMQRMQQLYNEYQQQEMSKAARQWDAQARLNHRQFMSQLLRVQERLRRELDLAELAVQQASQALQLAQVELKKMSTLHSQQQQKTRQWADMQEQRRLDALAMMRFNLGVNS